MAATTPIEVTVNGERRALPVDATLSDLLQELELGWERVAVEHNQKILSRDGLREVPLSDGDVLEIVHFVGGG